MIVFEDVIKVYDPDVVGLQDFTCHIGKGEFVFLVGPSGSGKSTLIKLVLKGSCPTQGAFSWPAAISAPCVAARCRSCGATSAACSRTSSFCPTRPSTTTSPTRSRSSANRGVPSVARSRRSSPWWACRTRPTATRTRSAAASSSASAWRAPSSIIRRCSSPTSPRATSTPRRPWASCSSSCASTAPAPRSWWPRTIATW